MTGDTTPAGESADGQTRPMLASRVFLTWLELTVVGITGGLLGGTLSGPPGFVTYLATTLVVVAIIFYNVDRHVRALLQAHKHQ